MTNNSYQVVYLLRLNEYASLSQPASQAHFLKDNKVLWLRISALSNAVSWKSVFVPAQAYVQTSVALQLWYRKGNATLASPKPYDCVYGLINCIKPQITSTASRTAALTCVNLSLSALAQTTQSIEEIIVRGQQVGYYKPNATTALKQDVPLRLYLLLTAN